MSYKYVIMDLDGTILDSLGMWAKIDREFLGKRGVPIPGDYQKAIASMTYRETAEYTIARFGLSDTPEALMQEWTDMAIKEYTENIELRPGARELIASLLDSGATIVCGTTLNELMLYPCLERHDILKHFKKIYTSRSTGLAKHNPGFFEYILKDLTAVPEDVLLFDDVAPVIKAAASLGIKTCGVPGGSSSREEFVPYADYILDDFFKGPQLNK